MVQTKTQESQKEILKQFAPPRVVTKESKYLPNPDMFVKEKTYIEKGQEKTAPANWRKFLIQGKAVTFFDGEKIDEVDYQLIKAEGKEGEAFFLAPVAKTKAAE